MAPDESDRVVLGTEDTGPIYVPGAKVPKIELFMASATWTAENHPDHNQDRYIASVTSRFAAIFDGAGGHKGGEDAAIAAEVYFRSRLAALPKFRGPGKAIIWLRDSLMGAHAAIVARRLELDYPEDSMVTTAICSLITPSLDGNTWLVLGQVGDSRLYLFRDDQLSYLTVDQGFSTDLKTQELFGNLATQEDFNLLPANYQIAWRFRNVVSSVLGKEPAPKVEALQLKSDDILLLMSDGISDTLMFRELAECTRVALRSNGRDQLSLLASSLVKQAVDRNLEQPPNIRAKLDDKTVVAISIKIS